MSRSVVSKMDDASRKEAKVTKFASENESPGHREAYDDEGSRDADDEGNVEETRSQALIHAKNCQKDSFCSKPYCHQMKKYLRHIDKCQDYESCLICPKIYAYDRFHSQYCSKSEKCVIDSRSCTLNLQNQQLLSSQRVSFSSHRPQENTAQLQSTPPEAEDNKEKILYKSKMFEKANGAIGVTIKLKRLSSENGESADATAAKISKNEQVEEVNNDVTRDERTLRVKRDLFEENTRSPDSLENSMNVNDQGPQSSRSIMNTPASSSSSSSIGNNPVQAETIVVDVFKDFNLCDKPLGSVMKVHWIIFKTLTEMHRVRIFTYRNPLSTSDNQQVLFAQKGSITPPKENAIDIHANPYPDMIQGTSMLLQILLCLPDHLPSGNTHLTLKYDGELWEIIGTCLTPTRSSSSGVSVSAPLFQPWRPRILPGDSGSQDTPVNVSSDSEDDSGDVIVLPPPTRPPIQEIDLTEENEAAENDNERNDAEQDVEVIPPPPNFAPSSLFSPPPSSSSVATETPTIGSDLDMLERIRAIQRIRRFLEDQNQQRPQNWWDEPNAATQQQNQTNVPNHEPVPGPSSSRLQVPHNQSDTQESKKAEEKVTTDVHSQKMKFVEELEEMLNNAPHTFFDTYIKLNKFDPPIAVQGNFEIWHMRMTNYDRQYVMMKIFDHPSFSKMFDRNMTLPKTESSLASYARQIEFQCFSDAKSKIEYFHLIANQMFKPESPSKNEASKESQGEVVCCICSETPERMYIFMDCGHLPFCEKCSNTIMKTKQRQCPICRKRVKKAVKAFFQQGI